MLPADTRNVHTRQYMLAGFKKVRDTERSEHTAIRPSVPSPVPTLPSHDTRNNPSEDLCSAKRDLLVYCKKPRFYFFLGFRPTKSQKRDNRISRSL